MARKPRIFFPGAFYHVIARGNGGKDIFYHDNDRIYFYKLLAETIKYYDYRIHAFCLMTNHVHIAIQISNQPLSRIMQNIMSRFARYINKQNRCFGHVFQGRYKAILVDSDTYLLQLIRYIHLNPVRAKIITDIKKYKWSSHNSYLNQTLSWLTTDFVLSHFARDKNMAITNYINFMSANMDTHLDKFSFGTQKSHDVLGDDNFLKKILSSEISPKKSVIQFESLVTCVCKYYSISEHILKSESRIRSNSKIRKIITKLAKDMNVATLTSIATYFNRDVTGLCRSLNKRTNCIDVPDDLITFINKSICQT